MWIVRADGRGLRNLTNHPAGDSHPSWSRDGRLMVFCSTRGDGENDDIYVTDADGSNPRRLTDNGLHRDTFPSFSPDGRRIAFSSNRSDAYQIYVMNPDGSGLMRVVDSPYTDNRPQWLPGGRGLIFNREHDARVEMLQVAMP